MGASGSIFEYSYQHERAELRRALILQFESDPNNHDVVTKIKLVREIITQYTHICATAAREAAIDEDNQPTTQQAAFNELDRLLTIYETSTILKSVQCRVGPVACPLGHFAPYMDNFSYIAQEKKKKPACNICNKTVKDGYHCSYCMYNLCVPCSVIYCSYGHAMKLWTHAESTHHCYICQKQPITSGYRCLECDEEIDFCDYCTWKDGRKFVQNIILERMAADLKYIEDHIEESETAMKTITTHRKKMAENSYATTLELYLFAESLHEIKEICVAEVRQTRITRAILKYRAILVVGKEYSTTAYEESLKEGNFTQEEQERLEALVDKHEYRRSVAYRSLKIVACPLGHGMDPFTGLPKKYEGRLAGSASGTAENSLLLTNYGSVSDLAAMFASPPSIPVIASVLEEDEKDNNSLAGFSGMFSLRGNKSKKKNKSQKEKAIAPPSAFSRTTVQLLCRVCQRNASPGYHCDYCEYDLCKACAVVFCHEGHPMIMWTEPSSLEKCFLCSTVPITSGYRCNRCSVDMCDMCTTREGRAKIRCDKESEMKELLQFMQDNKRFSDIALFYEWRHANQIASVGLLVDYVKELRLAKKSAEKQIQQKPIIDKIKLLRNEVIKHPDICATAARESAKSDIYVFKSKRKALDEMKRLAGLLKQMIEAQSVDLRAAAGVACPLSHAMTPIQPEELYEDFVDETISSYMLYGDANTTLTNISSVAVDEEKSKEFPSLVGAVNHKSLLPLVTPQNTPAESIINPPSGVNPNLLSKKLEIPSIQDPALGSSERMKLVLTSDGNSQVSLEDLSKELVEMKRIPVNTSQNPLHDHLAEGEEEGDSPIASPWKASKNQLIEMVSETMSNVDPYHSSSIPYFNNTSRRACRICATFDLAGGFTCRICEYDLCPDCSIMYCRKGHSLKIWTMPEARSLFCEVCKSSPIIAGYRCTICTIDICDMCTTRETRNAYLLWPRREFHKTIEYFENVADYSVVAKAFLENYHQESVKSYLTSMSRLCRKLEEIIEVKKLVDEELTNIPNAVKLQQQLHSPNKNNNQSQKYRPFHHIPELEHDIPRHPHEASLPPFVRK